MIRFLRLFQSQKKYSDVVHEIIEQETEPLSNESAQPRADKPRFITELDDIFEVRFTHVTSSRFEQSIRSTGLMRPNLQHIIRDTLQDYRVPEGLHSEVIYGTEMHPFGAKKRNLFACNPLYCTPMHQNNFGMMETYARVYNSGGETRRICSDIIEKVMIENSLEILPQVPYDAIVVIIRFLSREIVAPLFDPSFVSEFETCLNDFRAGSMVPPAGEVRINDDIHADHIERVLTIDEYNKYIHS